MSAEDVVRTCTIRELAKRSHPPVAFRTMFRRMLALHSRDRAEAEARGESFTPWLFRPASGKGWWRVNLSRLRLLHPEHFEAPHFEEIVNRLVVVESDVKKLRRKMIAVEQKIGRNGPE